MQSSVSAELQRLWLDARCTPPTSAQHAEKVSAFLSVFVASFAGRKHASFKLLFGDGADLCLLLCRDYAALARQLAQDSTPCPPGAAALSAVQLFAQGLRLLIGDESLSNTEIGRLASAYETYGNFNVVALSLVLHGRFIDYVASARLEDAVLPTVAQTDAVLLQLVDAVLACRRRELNRRSVLEATLAERVLAVATTPAAFFASPSSAGVEASESSCRILHQQLPNLMNVEIATETLERLEAALLSSQRRGTGAVAALHSLGCFACLLESILYAKQLVGFSPSETVSFDVVTATVLNFEKEVGDEGVPALRRVAGCLRVLALAERPDLAARKLSTPAANLGGSLLRMLPATVGKVQQRLVETWGGGERREAPQGIHCDAAVESLARLFVLSSRPRMSELYGQQLFQLLSVKGVSTALLGFALSICAESAAAFTEAKLRALLGFVGTLPCKGVVGDFLRSVVQQLRGGRFAQPPQRLAVVEFFIDWCPKAESNITMALALEVVQAAVHCMVGLVTDPRANALDIFAERFSVLCKVVVSSRDATASLVGDPFCGALLQVMLAALEGGEVHTAVLLRDAFVGLVLKTELFCDTLLEQIALATSPRTWSAAATPLLSTLVLLLHACGRHHRTSLPHNSIELCLSLTQQVEASSRQPCVDRHLIGCCLSLLLVLVNYSDVWELVERTIGTLPTSCAHVQSMLDLSTGVYRAGENLTVAEGYFTAAVECTELWSSPHFVHFGPFAVLREPYCEMVYPVKLLVQMTDALLSAHDAAGGDAVEAVDYLLLHSGVTVPNAFLVDFIAKWERFAWLRCVSNVSDAKLLPLFFPASEVPGRMLTCQQFWLEALASAESPQAEAHYGDYIHFGDGGGASGVLACSGDVWPPVDAYTTSMWVLVDPITLSGRQEGKVVLWQVEWDAAGRHCCVALVAHTQRKCCLYSCDFGGDVTVVELPMLPEEKWVHVATTHSRGKVFASQLKMFVNGVEVMRRGCPYPVSGLQTAAAVASSIPAMLSREVGVTVGAPRDTPGNNATLRVISFELYAAGASTKQVVSLYAMGPYRSSQVWDGAGRHQCDLRTSFLSDETIRLVEACLQSGALEAAVRDQYVELLLPPAPLLVSIHASAMGQVNAAFGYLNNKQWALHNMAPNADSSLSLHGYYRPPRGTHTNSVDALLCNGAFYEWLRWMAWVARTAHELPGSTGAGEEASEEAAAVRAVAHNMIRILSRSYKQTDLLPLSWRRFAAQFAEHVSHQPQVYLHDATAVTLLLQVCVRALPYRDKHQRPMEGLLLTNLFLLEHIFFDWALLSNLPEECWSVVMVTLRRLVAPSNALASFNASRLLLADFVNGFVIGLLRQYVAFPRLVAAIDLVKSVLLTGQATEELTERLLTACLLTVQCPGQEGGVSTTESNLGSVLSTTSLSYIVLVRNMLLRCLNEVLETTLSDGSALFLNAFVAVVPDWWFSAMLSGNSHPVSATLALRLLVLCFLHSKPFREGMSETKAECLAQALEPHCHQRELMDVLVHGYMGRLWAVSSSHAPYNTVAWSGKTEMEGLLVLVLHTLKAQCQLLLRGTSVPSEEGTVRGYFSAAATNAGFTGEAAPTASRRRRWRRVCHVLRAVQRLRRGAAAAKAAARREAASLAPAVLVASAAVLYTPSPDALKGSICEVLDWLTQSYRLSNALRKSLYRSNSAGNLIDLLMWPVLVALRPKERVALAPVASITDAGGSPAKGEAAEAEDAAGASSGSASELDETEEWEVLPDLSTFETRSFGMDQMGPAEGMDGVYDACKLFFLTHAASRAATADTLAVARGRTYMSKYVLALHRALAAEVKGVGSQSEDARQAFLCFVWLKASEQCIDRISSFSAGPVKRNALELGKYTLDRLVSGAAVPPNGIAGFYRFLLARVEGDSEVVKQSRTAIFEWFMYVTSASFYKLDAGKVGTVVDIAYGCVDTLFTSPMPAAELLKTVVGRLLQMTVCLWSGIADDANPSVKKMIALWRAVLVANQGSASLPLLFRVAAPPLDLFRDGFDRLLQPPSVVSAEGFSAWLRQHRGEAGQLLQTYGGISYPFVMASGVDYLRLITRHTAASVAEADRQRRHVSALVAAHRQQWKAVYGTTTFVDRALLACAARRYPNCYVLNGGAAAADVSGDVRSEWCLGGSGAVGRCRRYATERLEEVASDPLNFYIRYAPPMCLPLGRRDGQQASTAMLRPNARAVIAKVAGHGAGNGVVFASNAYLVMGTESYICTAMLTQREVIIITCSAVTPAGDFFVEQVRVHAAAQQSHAKSTLLQQAFRLLTLGQGQGTGSTTSRAAFCYSQYYRQLQTEAAKGSTALVWRFPLGVITAVHQRLFQHLSAGLEFVMESGESLFLVLLDDELSFSRTSRDRFFAYFDTDDDPTMAGIAAHTASEKQWGLAVWTRRWVRRECSNYAYLRILNDAASRSVANLGQYPVMPWTLRSYTAATLDLEDAAAYRDLSKPVGALNEAKAKQLQTRYAEWISTDAATDPPYHYGTHYSTAAIVLYYLIRLQPFTAHSIRFQGGRLDIADRLFHSVAEAWANSSGRSSGDVKELIPEFFRVSAFLQNRNRVALGTRSDGETLDDVVLPPWCGGSALSFVYMNALSLESEAVSAQLHRWIDLIFGYRQSGAAAVEAINVFSPLSYKEGVDRAISRAATEEERRSIVASADNFGQTPLQLFPREAHPARRDAAAAPTTQTVMLESLTDLATRPCVAAQVAVREGETVASAVFCDDSLFLLDRLSAVGSARPSQLLCYQPEMDRVMCTALRGERVLGSIDQIRASGCGPVRCLCASPRGSVVCIGCESGKVMVYSRETVRHRFFIVAVLDSTIDAALAAAGGVCGLHLFDEGQLVVAYDGASAVSGWHLSFLSTTFAFAVSLATAADSTAVRAVSQDAHTGLYYAVKTDSLVVFSPSGVVLGQHHMDALLMSAVPEYATRMSGSCITALHLANCASFSFSNLLLLGHSDGTVSLWCVVASQTMAGEADLSRTPPWSFQFLHDVVFEAPITCIAATREEKSFVVCLANNTARTLSFPLREGDSS